MSGQQAFGVALSKNGIPTVLEAILPQLSGAPVEVKPLAPIYSPAGSSLEPEEVDIYNLNVSNLVVSLISVNQQASQPGPPPSCTFDIATHLGFHLTTTWEEKGDTGN